MYITQEISSKLPSELGSFSNIENEWLLCPKTNAAGKFEGINFLEFANPSRILRHRLLQSWTLPQISDTLRKSMDH